MDAVIEKRTTKARAHKAATPEKAPAPAVSKVQTLFAQAGDFLVKASGTDEDHTFSGESDRLLSIGAGIALDAAQGKLSNSTPENTAYDVAACINAARLVPEDSESVDRTIYIDNAAKCLEAITGTAVHRMIFTDVPRPVRGSALTLEPAPVAGKQFTEEQLKELYWQAYLYADCARKVLFHYASDAASDEVFAFRDLLDKYLSRAEARLDADTVGTLIDGDLPEISADLCKVLSLLDPYATEKDDGVLHGVVYQLRSAKRIADGDLGVLE
ncbi:hypothetical protein [Comamonas odontotermitis]|uniref:hypothetical protein n=1 Tax=Comamonas odontotermitis TaxID=379895 RepID=UPI001CC60FE7|nr:hypothetical protein [Comamonas odontotermitis]UBB16168.1 hypothetical protein LAD35_15255 [Comamonas odontotermitis]